MPQRTADHSLDAGLNHGPVICRAGDLFASTVNIAARIAALSSPGQLLANPLQKRLAREVSGCETSDRWRLDRWRGSPSPCNRACSVDRPGLDQSAVQDPCSIFISAAARSGNSSDLRAGVVDKPPRNTVGLIPSNFYRGLALLSDPRNARSIHGEWDRRRRLGRRSRVWRGSF